MKKSTDQTEVLHMRKEKRAQDENVALLQYVPVLLRCLVV